MGPKFQEYLQKNRKAGSALIAHTSNFENSEWSDEKIYKTLGISEKLLKHLREVYPPRDIAPEIKNIIGWVEKYYETNKDTQDLDISKLANVKNKAKETMGKSFYDQAAIEIFFNYLHHAIYAIGTKNCHTDKSATDKEGKFAYLLGDKADTSQIGASLVKFLSKTLLKEFNADKTLHVQLRDVHICLEQQMQGDIFRSITEKCHDHEQFPAIMERLATQKSPCNTEDTIFQEMYSCAGENLRVQICGETAEAKELHDCFLDEHAT